MARDIAGASVMVLKNGMNRRQKDKEHSHVGTDLIKTNGARVFSRPVMLFNYSSLRET